MLYALLAAQFQSQNDTCCGHCCLSTVHVVLCCWLNAAAGAGVYALLPAFNSVLVCLYVPPASG